MSDVWTMLVEAARARHPHALPAIDDPSLAALVPIVSPDVRVVAHLAQSLDGRIALPDGCSRWISGEEDLVHTHRLRALCDAVVVGAHTVEADDPQLTTRRVSGPNPVRVVIDPEARLHRGYKVFSDGEAPTWRVTSRPTGSPDDLVLSAVNGVIPPESVVAALHARGLRRILVEGGGVTVSRFVAAGAVDHLHLVIAPVLVGMGRPGLTFGHPLAASLDTCPRPPTRTWMLGKDVLLDCDLSPPYRVQPSNSVK
ncbi:MAG: RibD family protein [Myxococcota bacterium]